MDFHYTPEQEAFRADLRSWLATNLSADLCVDDAKDERIAQFATELLGAHTMVNEPSEFVPDAPRWFNRMLSARQYTISAGTSEIQRNIMSERVLGLPKG